jgi:hypothetical protein
MNNKILLLIGKVFTIIFIILIILFLIPTIIYFFRPVIDSQAMPRNSTRLFSIIYFIVLLILSVWKLIKPNKILRIIVGSLYILTIIVFISSWLIAKHFGYI